MAQCSFLLHLNRGICFDKLSRCEEAVRDFTDVTKQTRSKAMLATAYFNRGSSRDSMGQYDEAIKDYALSLEHDLASESKSGAQALPQ